MTRVVVQGGRGFIGRHLATALRAGGHAVLACEQEGLADDARLLRGFAPEALVWAGGTRAGDPAALHEMHVAAPLANLEACAATLRRLVYLSSAEVYGPDAPVPFREEQPPRPASEYACAKWRAEAALAERCAALGVRLVVLRPAVVYGPGQTGPAFVPQLLAALAAGRRFPMTAGQQTRDFLHVADLCALVDRALAPAAPAGLYNAGTGDERRLLDVARLGAALAEETIRPGAAALLEPGALPYRSSEQWRYVLDPTRARERLGWQAATPLEAGLRATLAALAARAV
jgi:nucleoside-diphosphate-sugar epimerase